METFRKQNCQVNRNQRQDFAAERWANSGGLGGIVAFTGFGKTRIAIELILKRVLEKNPGRNCIIVSHRVALVEQWKKNIVGLLNTELINRIQVVTGDFILQKGIKFETTLLIVDEIDEFYGDIESGIWDGRNISYKFFLWLSATPKDKRGIWQRLYTIAPAIDKITKKEGLENGWLTNCLQFNLSVSLNEKERERYDGLSKEIGDTLGKFGGDFSLAQKCLSGDKFRKAWDYCVDYARNMGWDSQYPFIVNKSKPSDWSMDDYIHVIDVNNLWHPEKVIGYASRLFEMTRERNYLLHKCEQKYEKALEVARFLTDYKIVFFSQSTEFAHNLYERINQEGLDNCVEYHSKIVSRPLKTDSNGNPSLFSNGDYVKIKTKTAKGYGEPKIYGADTIKKLSLQAFITNQVRILSLGSALDKGLDVPDIGIGVITSQTSSPTQYTQRKGRTTRLSDGKESSILICIYAKETVDQNYLRNVQRNTDGEIYWIDKVEDISMDYVPNMEEEEFDLMELL